VTLLLPMLRHNLISAPHLQLTRLWLWIGLSMIFAIVALSVMNPPVAVKQFLLHDKLLHALAYAGLMGWFAQIFHHRTTRVLLVIVFVAMGIGVEYLQAFNPRRLFDVSDMIANGTGVLIAWALAHTSLGHLLAWFEKHVLRVGSAQPR